MTECVQCVVPVVRVTTTDAHRIVGLQHTGTVHRVRIVNRESILVKQARRCHAQIVNQEKVLVNVRHHVVIAQQDNILVQAGHHVGLVVQVNILVKARHHAAIVRQDPPHLQVQPLYNHVNRVQWENLFKVQYALHATLVFFKALQDKTTAKASVSRDSIR